MPQTGPEDVSMTVLECTMLHKMRYDVNAVNDVMGCGKL